MILVGEYRLTLDDEGRLRLPAVIRNTLHELFAPGDSTLIVSSFYESCLVLFPGGAAWLKALKQIQSEGTSRELIELFRSSAAASPIDSHGRVSIHWRFRQYAGIEREVLLLGVVTTLELWSRQRWEDYEAEEAKQPKFLDKGKN